MINNFKKKKIKKASNQIPLQGLEEGYDYNFKSLGILIDKKEVASVEAIVTSFRQKGYVFDQIKVLVYSGFIKDKKSSYPSFSLIDFSLNGVLKSSIVNDFINTDFDLLMNFYDKDTIPLVYVSTTTKAKFRVGVASVSKSVNHFSLEVKELNASQYVNHLVDYINIFKTQ